MRELPAPAYPQAHCQLAALAFGHEAVLVPVPLVRHSDAEPLPAGEKGFHPALPAYGLFAEESPHC